MLYDNARGDGIHAVLGGYSDVLYTDVFVHWNGDAIEGFTVYEMF